MIGAGRTSGHPSASRATLPLSANGDRCEITWGYSATTTNKTRGSTELALAEPDREKGTKRMSNIDKIQSAEAKVADLQDALSAVQAGLERAEQVAIAAEEAKNSSERLIKVALALVGLSILLIVLSRRRSA